jgi:hypothetical protein
MAHVSLLVIPGHAQGMNPESRRRLIDPDSGFALARAPE